MVTPTTLSVIIVATMQILNSYMKVWFLYDFIVYPKEPVTFAQAIRETGSLFNLSIMKYVARQSNYIQEDIARNWSSWNFGMEGINATKEQLDAFLESVTDDSVLHISGFELYGNSILKADIRELYTGYFVLVDNENANGGLSAIELNADSLESAITEANTRTDYCGDGVCFDAQTAKLVYSNKEIHIFEIED